MASDEEAAKTARLDQGKAATADFAAQTVGYWSGLRSGGMTRGEATSVTGVYVRALMEFGLRGGKS